MRLHPVAFLSLFALLAFAPAAGATQRAHTPTDPIAGASTVRAEAARVLHYWTPARMASARPLDLVVDGGDGDFVNQESTKSTAAAHLRVGRRSPTAGASFLTVPAPEEPPNSVEGRIFVKQGNLRGYCSGTAINTPTRQLVLTAGHCVNNGHEGGHTVWSQYLEFVPAYTAGEAPFGAFVAKRGAVYAPKPWTMHGNPDFDLGAFLTHPNRRGLNVADAVGGGATIAFDLTRRQQFRTFGYPGNIKRMQGCSSPYVGDDRLSFPLPGPPTMSIRCHWAPGASGGGWLIGDGGEIDGLNSYLRLGNRSHTYGPYFASETVGKLVEGL